MIKIRKWIVVFSFENDPHYNYLLEECTDIEKENILLFPSNKPNFAQVMIDVFLGKFILEIGNTSISSSEIKTIWWRGNVLPKFDNLSEELEDYCKNDYRSLYNSLEHCDSLINWFPRPSSVYHAKNKILQLVVAKKVGLNIPRTYSTNHPDYFSELWNNNQTIFKSLNTPNVSDEKEFRCLFTVLLTYNMMKYDDPAMNYNSIIKGPGVIQDFVDKKYDIRVCMFGDKCHAVKIHSQEIDDAKIDFRTVDPYKLKHTPHQLPKNIQKKCVEFMTQLNLSYGIIDFVLTHNNKHIFLEVNPTGQWGWLEEISGIKLRRALLNVLFE